tara:strand:- start:14275 stop:14508 length:234 start_codon:yes stop_codon:yes gene_type:complete
MHLMWFVVLKRIQTSGQSVVQLIYSHRFLIDVFQLSIELHSYDFSFSYFWQEQRPRINVKAGNLIFHRLPGAAIFGN